MVLISIEIRNNVGNTPGHPVKPNISHAARIGIVSRKLNCFAILHQCAKQRCLTQMHESSSHPFSRVGDHKHPKITILRGSHVARFAIQSAQMRALKREDARRSAQMTSYLFVKHHIFNTLSYSVHNISLHKYTQSILFRVLIEHIIKKRYYLTN